MTPRPFAIVLVAVFGVLSIPAAAQTSGEPATPHPAKPGRVHAKRAAKAPAAAPAPILGGEAEASSLERRRRAFFGAKPDEAAPDGRAPSAGVTLGGSGGITPGMGLKF